MDSSTASDEALVGQLSRKDYPAFVKLFDKYRSRILSFAARMTGDPDEAERLTHDAFVRMVNDAQRYDQSQSCVTWMFGIAREIVSAFVAKNKPEAKASLEKLASIGCPPEASTDARRTYEALNKIGHVYREVLYLRVYEGLSYSEISEITGEKVPAVVSRMNYAVEHIRKEIS